MDKVVTSILVLFIAFLMQYAWQYYRAHNSLESLLESIEIDDGLAEHTKEFGEPQIVQVTGNVYVAIGFAIANSIMIVGRTSIVIVDTTETYSSAKQIYTKFREITDKPVEAIIYTHNHPDHILGTQAFIEDLNGTEPAIWGHSGLVGQVYRIARLGPVIYSRAAKQFGRFLDKTFVNAGIGPRLKFERKADHHIYLPNKLLEGDELDVTMAGIKMKLMHIPGETSDQMGVYIPDQNMFLCGDDIYKTFPNLYAIRGTPNRDLNLWVNSLDKMRTLNPEYLVPSHGQPVKGREVIYDLLTVYRDAIQFVHDQTVRWINKGMHPDDIAYKVILPDRLRNHRYLREYYGTVPWSVKSVFSGYLGWFSGDIAEMNPLPTKEKAALMIELAGGKTAMLSKAQQALDNGNAQWALELASHVHRISPSNSKAKSIRLEAVKILAGKQTSANGRNFYITEILIDNGLELGEISKKPMVGRMPLSNLFKTMGTRLKAEVCGDTNVTVVFNFTDVNELYTCCLRNGILEILTRAEAKYDVKVTVTSAVWKDIILKERSPAMAYMGGDFVLDGGLLTVKNFFDCFDRDD